MFVSDEFLRQRVAAALKRSGGSADISTSSFWPIIVSDANAAAYNEIVSRLSARGYSAAQIAAWDRGAEFENYLGVLYALQSGAALDGFDDKWVEKLRKWEEKLDDVTVTNGGVFQSPVGPQGTVGTGRLEQAVLPDPLGTLDGDIATFPADDLDISVRW